MSEKCICHLLEKNIGGSGGFNRGIKEACKEKCDYVLVLDDDCILNSNYIENLVNSYEEIINSLNIIDTKDSGISALCGTVLEGNKIATNHRGYFVKHKIFKIFDYWKEHNVSEYQKKYLFCDLASFCGLMISKQSIDRVGYPKAEYFIKCDDLEYTMRLCKVGKIVNINSSLLNHKVNNNELSNDLDWKYYYDTRNSIDMTKTNGLLFCTIKTVIKSYVVAILNIYSNTQSIKIWKRAISDGFKGRLGKNDC